MNTKHYFQHSKPDGRWHYALSGTQGRFSYAITATGAPGAENSDVGVRSLGLAARETIFSTCAWQMSIEPRNIGHDIIQRANLKTIFPHLDPQFLDASLVVAWVDDGRLTCFIYGRGDFLHLIGDSTRTVRVDFQSPKALEWGSPDYLSYSLDAIRKEDYMELGHTKTIHDQIESNHKTSGETRTVSLFSEVDIRSPVAGDDLIIIRSSNDVIKPIETIVKSCQSAFKKDNGPTWIDSNAVAAILV